MHDFLMRFRALGYDHPWHTYPYVFGLFFLAVSTADWVFNMSFGREVDSFLERMVFSATIALFVQYLDRRREARHRDRAT